MKTMLEPATWPHDSGGILMVILGESSPVRNLAISQKPGGGIFGRSSWWGSSSVQHTGTGEPLDEVELEFPRPLPHCSSLPQCWTLLQLELWLWWHHLKLPQAHGNVTHRGWWLRWVNLHLARILSNHSRDSQLVGQCCSQWSGGSWGLLLWCSVGLCSLLFWGSQIRHGPF